MRCLVNYLQILGIITDKIPIKWPEEITKVNTVAGPKPVQQSGTKTYSIDCWLESFLWPQRFHSMSTYYFKTILTIVTPIIGFILIAFFWFLAKIKHNRKITKILNLINTTEANILKRNLSSDNEKETFFQIVSEDKNEK